MDRPTFCDIMYARVYRATERGRFISHVKEIGNKVFSIGISLYAVRDFTFIPAAAADVEYIALIGDRPKALIVKEGKGGMRKDVDSS